MNSIRRIFSLALLLIAMAVRVFAQDSAFTYQGRLNTGGGVANEVYEMTFTLFDSATNGAVIGSQTVAPLTVSNGLFAATLDFGAAAFNGAPRWLEISVNLFGSDMIPTILAPRQRITSAPYAIHAGTTGNLISNGGTPVEIRAGGVRALRIEPTTGAANIIGGYAQNSVSNGVIGAFIGGGGLNDGSEGNYPNRVNASYSAIVGGFGNTVSDESAFIGGGVNNRIAIGANTSAIVGGHLNAIEPGSYESFIGAGRYNVVGSFSEWSVVSGGYENMIGSNSVMSTIGGGVGNVIETNANRNTIAGGSGNRIGHSTFYNFIGGGNDNVIEEFATVATISGGEENTIGQNASLSTIAGGENNRVSSLAVYSSIGGGYMNVAGFDAPFSVIAGGKLNEIGSESPHSTIGGGVVNRVGASVEYATVAGGLGNFTREWETTISGGRSNYIDIGSFGAVIGGGLENQIQYLSLAATISGGVSNVISAVNAVIGGGEQNSIDSGFGTIAGGYSNWISFQADGATIGGGMNNTIDSEGTHSTIGGGFQNFIDHDAGTATIAGGRENNVKGDGGSVGGGWGNTARGYSVVAGGFNNYGFGAFSTVSGGTMNTNGGEYGVLAGGLGNVIASDADLATIGGGATNRIRADATHAIIAGGRNNAIGVDSDYSTIGGGEANSLSDSCEHAVIAGGKGNRIEKDGGYMATIAGGLNNTNRGNYATIPGGRENVAGGDYTLAAGRRALAQHQGSLVWADSSDFAFNSTNRDEFAARATGGVRFISGIDAAGSNTAGVVLAPGAGGWASLSDRNAKANFTSVNPREILEKVAALPMTTWNYKSQDQSIRHIGPMAQDFHAAFSVGESDRTITTVDADGVALAAIQGLNQKIEAENRELRSAVASRDARLVQLQQRLEQIEKLLMKSE